MKKYNLKQLKIFNPQDTYLFSEKPCVVCGSHYEVLAVLFKLPGKKYHELAYLCNNCRSNPAIIKG